MNIRLTSSQLFAMELARHCLPHLQGPGVPAHDRWEHADIKIGLSGAIIIKIRVRGFAPRIFARCSELKSQDGVWREGLCSITMDGEGGRHQHFRCVVNGGAGGLLTPMILAEPIAA